MRFEDPPFGILVAFNHWTDGLDEAVTQTAALGVPILIDSGAFANWQRGTTITFAQYGEFLNRLRFAPWGYFNLDVIGDPVGSDANEHALRAMGFRPIPVFTRTASPDTLRAMLERSEVVGVGGMAGNSKNPAGFAKLATRIAGPGRLHLLGQSRVEIVYHLRPRSFDSSRWIRGRKFGYVQLWLGRGRYVRHSFSRGSDRDVPPPILHALSAYGYTQSQLLASSEMRYALGIRNQLAEAIAVYPKTRSLCFFAVTGAAQIQDVVREYVSYLKGGWSCPV